MQRQQRDAERGEVVADRVDVGVARGDVAVAQVARGDGDGLALEHARADHAHRRERHRVGGEAATGDEQVATPRGTRQRYGIVYQVPGSRKRHSVSPPATCCSIGHAERPMPSSKLAAAEHVVFASASYSPTILRVSRTPSRNALSATNGVGEARHAAAQEVGEPRDLAAAFELAQVSSAASLPSTGRPSSAIRDSATSTSPGRAGRDQVAALARQTLALEVLGEQLAAARAARRAPRRRSTCCIVNIIDGYWIASPIACRAAGESRELRVAASRRRSTRARSARRPPRVVHRDAADRAVLDDGVRHFACSQQPQPRLAPRRALRAAASRPTARRAARPVSLNGIGP